ncbi:MAG: hypothetical protein LBS89_08350 [Zoogloeaceae bacterium]|nr:hypothetical protein [Zoogloeaceae bacterium]
MKTAKVFAWVTLASLVVLLVLVALGALFMRDEALHPDTEKMLHHQPPPVPAEANIFVARVGFDAPAGSDFVRVGEEIIQRVNQGQKIMPDAERLEFSLPIYAYPCAKEVTENCLEEIHADADNILRLMEENGELAERYLTMQNMPVYVDINSRLPWSLSTNGMEVTKISRLFSAAAVLYIQDGKVAEGLGMIGKDMEFHRRIFASPQAALTDKMIALANIRQHVILLNLLIEQGKLNEHTETARFLLRPLAAPRDSIMDAFLKERVYFLREFADTQNSPVQQFLGVLVFLMQTGGFGDDDLLDYLAFFVAKKNMSLNFQYALEVKAQEILREMPTSQLPSVYDTFERQLSESMGCVKTRFTVCWNWRNSGGEFLSFKFSPGYVSSLLRVHDQDAHIRLVRAQLEYQLAAKNPGVNLMLEKTPEQILPTLGAETFNPYTGQPFEFDSERKTLIFQPADPSWKRQNKPPLEVRLLS